MRPSFLIAQGCFACVLLVSACSSEPEIKPPPPLPTVVLPAPPPPGAGHESPASSDVPTTPVEAVPEPSVPKPSEAPVPAKKGASLYDLEPKAKPSSDHEKTKSPERQPANAGEPYKPAADPQTVLKEPTVVPPPKPFVAPESKHVTLELPSGLKSDLARDTRMGAWLSRGVAAAGRCYEKEAAAKPNLAGAITVGIVMHENDLPSAEIKSLDPSLTGVFSCVTSAMMSSRIPLFTGKEGQRYTAVVRFVP